jgi:hypothetical protein
VGRRSGTGGGVSTVAVIRHRKNLSKMSVPIELISDATALKAIDDTIAEFEVFSASLIGPTLKTIGCSSPWTDQGYDGGWAQQYASKIENELSASSLFRGERFSSIPIGLKRCAILHILTFVSSPTRSAIVQEFLASHEPFPSVLVFEYLEYAKPPWSHIFVNWSLPNEPRRLAENFAVNFAFANSSPPVQLNLFSGTDRCWHWFDFRLGSQRPLSAQRCPAEIQIASKGRSITLTSTINRKPSLDFVRTACKFE